MSKVATEKAQIDALLSRGVEEAIVREHLEAALVSGKLLRVKFGIDPTRPDIHLGHTVTLRKLRQFQDAGHTAVLIIGDFTAMIGDPSGRAEARMPLTKADVKHNLKNYLEQAGRVIDLKKTEVRYNSEWYEGNANLLLELQGRESIQRLLERDDFQKRLKEGREITLLETLYPLLQGYDSVVVKADVELGGTDQKFNLLMGRKLQRQFNMAEQDVITLPLLEGTDGVRKMSKSYDNYIALNEKADVMFGKIMSVPDALIDKYYTLLTDNDRAIEDPRDAKMALGVIIVDMYHGTGEGAKAKEEFVRVFSKHGKPTDIPEVHVGAETLTLTDLLVAAGVAKSKTAARRLIEQGGVRLDDEKQNDPEIQVNLSTPRLLQAGPRKFLRVLK